MKDLMEVLKDEDAMERVREIARAIFTPTIVRCFAQKIRFGKYNGEWLWGVPFKYVTDNILDMHSSVLTVAARVMVTNEDVLWLCLRNPTNSVFSNLMELLGSDVEKWPERGREVEWWWSHSR